MATVSIANTTANISGKTMVLAERDHTITGSWTYSRSPSAPFSVASGSAKVTNLDADMVDGVHAAGFATLSGGFLPVAQGGTNSGTTLNNNRIAVTTGGAIVEAAALTNGQLLVGSTGAAPVAAAITAGSGITVTNGAGSISIAASGWVLLKAGNGADTSAGATVVDSIALSGLTANDRLKVFYSLTGATANTAQVTLYSVTDSAVVVNLSPSPLAFGDASACAGEVQIGQRQGSANQVLAQNQGMLATPARNDFFLFTAPVTAWTGSWTLGLRHGGVTATGTLKWSWAVYKLAGQ